MTFSLRRHLRMAATAAALALAGALSAVPASAQVTPLDPAAYGLADEPILLTQEILDKFLVALPIFVTEGDAIGARHGLTVAADPAATYAGLIANPAALAEMNALVIPYGFVDIGDFLGAFVAVLPAALIATGIIPPEEVAATRARMAIPPTDENIALVTANLPAVLQALMEAGIFGD